MFRERSGLVFKYSALEASGIWLRGKFKIADRNYSFQFNGWLLSNQLDLLNNLLRSFESNTKFKHEQATLL